MLVILKSTRLGTKIMVAHVSKRVLSHTWFLRKVSRGRFAQAVQSVILQPSQSASINDIALLKELQRLLEESFRKDSGQRERERRKR